MPDLVVFEPLNTTIALVILNRPSSCNALSGRLLRDFLEVLEEVESSNTYRVLIMAGRGRHFCAGLDLKEAGENSGPYPAKTMAAMVARVLVKLRTSHLITLAAAQGTAVGGGGGIVAACDLAVGTENFRIAFPEVRHGLEPALLFPLLKRRMNDSLLSDFLITGRPIDATDARSAGLLRAIVAEGELIDHAKQMAEAIAQGEPKAVRRAKQRILSRHETDFAWEMQQAVREHARSWETAEAKEGIRAFLEKRAPRWQP